MEEIDEKYFAKNKKLAGITTAAIDKVIKA